MRCETKGNFTDLNIGQLVQQARDDFQTEQKQAVIGEKYLNAENMLMYNSNLSSSSNYHSCFVLLKHQNNPMCHKV